MSNRHAIDGDSLAAKTGSFRTEGVGSDNEPPAIACTVPDQTLWHGSDVSVPCTASDSGSGLANPGDANFTLSTSVPAGAETSSAVTDSRQVCDLANNCATAGPFTFKVDKKPPQLLNCDSPDGLWHASDVTLHCHYADAGSGPAAQDIALATHVPDGTDNNNAIASAGSSRACDNVGNCALSPADIAGNKIDKKKPVITISVPASGATYAPGQVVQAAYTCDDGTGSGIATCTGPVANGANIDTSAGSHVFTVTATDNVGNLNSASVTYSVAGYAFSGFLSPVNNPPTVNTGKAGKTYPIKWQLRDANGNYISALSVVVGIVIKPTSCDALTSDPTDALETNTTGGTSLGYDSAANQYVYNWGTPGKGCYTLFLKLDSGQVFTAFFRLLTGC